MPLAGRTPWYEQRPSEALGWATDGGGLVRVWKSDCGQAGGRGTVNLVEGRQLIPLPCLEESFEKAIGPRDVADSCVGPASAPESRQRLCSPRNAEPPCGPGALLGVAYEYELRTHCGIADAFFDGRWWLADPPLDDGSHNPPARWGNPTQRGSMRLLFERDRAEFRAEEDLVARFRLAPPSYQPDGCA